MNKKTLDKKLALKLINKYADQYNQVAEENKNLLRQINDLKSNININKDIINIFLSKYTFEEKVNKLFIKYKENIEQLEKSNENIYKNYQKLVKKVYYYQEIINNSITDSRISLDNLNNKIFILENTIIQKDNVIFGLNKKVKLLLDEISNAWDTRSNANICGINSNLNKINGFNNSILSDFSSDDDKNDKIYNQHFNESNKNDINNKNKNINNNDDNDQPDYIKSQILNKFDNVYNSNDKNSNMKTNNKKNYSKYYHEIYVIDPSESVNIIQDDLLLYKQAYETALLKLKNCNKIIDEKNEKIIKLREQLSEIQGIENCSFDDEGDVIINSNVKKATSNNEISSSQEELIKKLKNEIKNLNEKNLKLTNENMHLYKNFFELKNSVCNNNININNYLNTNISLIGNNTSREEKNLNKIDIIKNNKRNYKFIPEKLNQSADGASIDLNNISTSIKNLSSFIGNNNRNITTTISSYSDIQNDNNNSNNNPKNKFHLIDNLKYKNKNKNNDEK